MSTARKLLLKYGITTLVAGLVSCLFLYLHDFDKAQTLVEKYRLLADAFTIPGVILIMVAALIWISSDGFFDGIAYAMRQFGGLFIPPIGKKYRHESYYDYKVAKAEKRPKGYAFLFFVGLVFFITAIVFIILHGTVYVPNT